MPLHLFDYKLVSRGCSWESHELRVVLRQEGDWRSMPASLCLGPCLCVCHSDTWGLLYHRNARAGLTQNLCSSGQAEGTLRLCPSNSWSESPSSRETRLDSSYLLCFDCSQGRANQSEDHHGVGWWRECETKVVFQELDCAQSLTLLGKWGVPEEREGEPVCIGAEVGPRRDSGRVPGASLSLCSSPAMGWWPSISAWAPEATRRPGTTISVVHIHLNNAHLPSNCFIGIQLKLTFLPTLNQRAGSQRSGMNGVVLFQLLKVTAFVFVPKSAFQPYLKFQHSSSFSHTWNSNTLPLSQSQFPSQFPCLFILNFLSHNETWQLGRPWEVILLVRNWDLQKQSGLPMNIHPNFTASPDLDGRMVIEFDQI